jgi:hypothetical protein
MPVITSEVVLALLALLLCSIATLRAIIYRKRMNQQARLLAETCEALTDARQKLAILQEKNKKLTGFQESLNQAEFTARLQESRSSLQHNNRKMSPPERYRYVHSLATSGMSSQEIATILTISIHEAEQLVNLSRLAHPK